MTSLCPIRARAVSGLSAECSGVGLYVRGKPIKEETRAASGQGSASAGEQQKVCNDLVTRVSQLGSEDDNSAMPLMKLLVYNSEPTHFMTYIHQQIDDASTSLDDSFKVKSAMNETNGSSKQTGGQNNQRQDGSGKQATTSRTVAKQGSGGAADVARQDNDDGDDDDKRPPPSIPGKKQLGCGRPVGHEGVVHGQNPDLKAFVRRLGKKQGLPPEELKGQEGVLLDQALTPVHGSYKLNEHFTSIEYLAHKSSREVVLIEDWYSKKRAVAKIVPIKEFKCNGTLLWLRVHGHPRIIGVLGLMRSDDKVILFSEFHQGSIPLDKFFSSPEHADVRCILPITEQMFEVQDYLHVEERMVHKDFYGDNILVIGCNPQHYQIKLIDFDESKGANEDEQCKEVSNTLCMLFFIFEKFTKDNPDLQKFNTWLESECKKHLTAAQVLQSLRGFHTNDFPAEDEEQSSSSEDMEEDPADQQNAAAFRSFLHDPMKGLLPRPPADGQ